MEELEYYREVRNDVFQEMASQKDTPHPMFYGSSYVFSDEMLGENRELEYFMCLCYVACGLYELEGKGESMVQINGEQVEASKVVGKSCLDQAIQHRTVFYPSFCLRNLKED